MDEKELQQNIALYYSKLSPKLQDFFSSMGWLQTLTEIAQKYSLNAEQTQSLGTETTLVLLGIIHLDEFYNEVEKQLSLPEEILKIIIGEVNTLVLNPIQGDLIGAYNENNIDIKDETLDKRFENVPDEVKKIIQESNYKITLYNIAKEYGLNVIDMGILENDMVGLMVGSVRPSDFEEKIKNNLKLPGEKTRGLVTAINDKILKEIREKMEQQPPRLEMGNTDDTQILNTAGIEILPKETATLPVPEKLEIVGTVKPVAPTPNYPIPPKPSILEQKLTAPVKTEAVKTEHSLNNLTPSKPVVDPYREIPE